MPDLTSSVAVEAAIGLLAIRMIKIERGAAPSSKVIFMDQTIAASPAKQ